MTRDYATIAPVGQVGDGSVMVGYDPNPPHNRSAFELYYAWDGQIGKADTVYIGGEREAEALVDALEGFLDD